MNDSQNTHWVLIETSTCETLVCLLYKKKMKHDLVNKDGPKKAYVAWSKQ